VGSSQVYCQRDRSHLITLLTKCKSQTCLGEATVVPDVTVVRETVANVAQATLFNVLLDRIEQLFFGYLHLCVGPARDLHDHVENAIVLVREEGNVMERRDNGSILFDVDTMF
jgi:hypothetical protein